MFENGASLLIHNSLFCILKDNYDNGNIFFLSKLDKFCICTGYCLHGTLLLIDYSKLA